MGYRGVQSWPADYAGRSVSGAGAGESTRGQRQKAARGHFESRGTGVARPEGPTKEKGRRGKDGGGIQ